MSEQTMSDEDIARAHVTPPTLHNAPVHLADYDPAWPARYERLAAGIRRALGGVVLRLEHVGSTSVPGLCAKPILDILLTVADPADEAAYVPPLEAVGYVLHIREPDWYEHRVLKVPGGEMPVHLHVLPDGCLEVPRMLGFRDRLRQHDEDRDLYARTKRDLARRTWKYVQNYADAKGEVVESILARAGVLPGGG
ncbi:GrpB family protein [Nonomuraea sp. NPDC050404]|uniref:GrpB family protein n=1 Tax=Nonomuraea sp. NPDC050404 TaxID=3155783 RepID=UPI0033D4D66C